MNLCSIEGCASPTQARGMCNAHYQKHRRSEGVTRRMTAETAYVLGEVEWLLSFGLSPELIAKQLDKTIWAITQLAKVHGRRDLAAPFQVIESRNKRAA